MTRSAPLVALFALFALFAISSCAPAALDEPPTTRDAPPAPHDDVTAPLVDALGTVHDELAPHERDTTAPTELTLERDRLLDTLGPRCDVWSGFDDGQRAQLLLLTDLLGKRSALEDGSSALAHVVTLYAVRGQRSEGCVRCCGDGEYNRAYFSVDDALAHALRTGGLAAWEDSNDLAGPHDPFTMSLETRAGQPTGQAHFFARNEDAVPLGRMGVEGVNDAHAIEIDIDFNLVHESSPLCEYGGETGLERYERVWRDEGAGGDAELAYVPTGC
jgi:hypothetical protein